MNANTPPLLWNPSETGARNSRLADFKRAIEKQCGHAFGACDQNGYEELLNWSVEQPEKFWDSVWNFCGITGERGKTVLEKSPAVPWARFFPDSKISYAENILKHAQENPSAPAIIARLQGGEDRVITGKDLCDQASLWQQALIRAGIKESDRVAVYLPNIPETIFILLAASNIGAVFSSAGMEMGAADLINRLSQVKPSILIAADGYIHGRKTISRMDVIVRAEAEIPGLMETVVINFTESTTPRMDFLDGLKAAPLTFTRRAFNHPLYILFSSGSTGKPKCFEHSTGGILLKHLCEQQLGSDISENDRVFYHATPSWMMWNWLVSVLASGAAILLYEGNPAHPDSYAQWDFTSRNNCTHHGTAAPVILSWAKSGIAPKDKYDLAPLRMILSTGAVLPAQGFAFIHENIKSSVKISSIAGGTDIVGCFFGGNMFTPTYAGQINGPMLGMDIKILDDDGNEIKPGETGELCCLNPFPSMPLRFLDDEGSERYKAEYFDHYPDKHIWRHGDSVQKTLEGQYIIIGRSDATLNQNGVRIGTASIYDQLAPFNDQIRDAAAVDFIRPDNQQAITILFLAVVNPDRPLDPELQNNIRNAIKYNVTPYAIPTEIIAVPDILKTPNGKKAEVVMKKLINGKSIPNASLYGENLLKFYENYGQVHKNKYG
ncbi:MAG: acetoacetate--CoA ligase [Alphaproteobacteria bacterium]